MSTNTIVPENGSHQETGAKPKRECGANKAKAAKKARQAKKTAGKPKADRANKKAEVIAMMKRAKGTTLAEIMKATDWQPHTIRKGGEKIESSKNAAGERQDCFKQVGLQTPLRARAGRRFCFWVPSVNAETSCHCEDVTAPLGGMALAQAPFHDQC